MTDLSGKVILITGGSRGIGAAAVEAALKAGANVIAHCSQNKAAAAKHGTEGSKYLVIAADLAEAEGPAKLWDEALAWKGRIDVLVNNAGIYEPDHEAGSTAEWRAAWQRTLQVNLIAPAELARAATKHFEGRGGGAIINIASRAAFRGDQADYGAYAASKGGLVALNHTIARSAAAKGVVAYAIAGTVDIDLQTNPLGQDADGKDVFLKDVWPTQKEVQDTVATCVTREQFVTQYANVFDGSQEWQDVKSFTGALYE